jgi:hypothetical protein
MITVSNIINSVSNNNGNSLRGISPDYRRLGSEDSVSFVSMQASIAFLVIFIVIVISMFMRPFINTRIMNSQYQPL